MATYSKWDCEAPVVCGFQEFVSRKLFDSSEVTMLGAKTYWCRKHENGLSIQLRSGRYLFDKDLEQLAPANQK